MDIRFQGIWRMDWGFGNPNKTAAVIAVLMVVVWILPVIRRGLFWVALPLFTALGVCLMHTMSRGGFLAVFAGLGGLVLHLRRPFPVRHVMAVGTAIGIMMAGAVFLQTTTRFAQSYRDRSITNRARIWQSVPRMVVDAPQGWGWGQGGNVYVNWYQPVVHRERYRNLVNSHFDWLVEFGWPMRVVYVAGWALVFVLCHGGACREKAGYGVAFGVWVAFFAASTFSSVAESPWVWCVPILCLFGVLLARANQGVWPRKDAWGLGLLASIGALMALYGFGIAGPKSPFTLSPRGTICVGENHPKLAVIISPLATPGTVSENFPRNYRDYCQGTSSQPGAEIARALRDLPDLTGRQLAIIGPLPPEEWKILPERAKECEQLILIAPDIPRSALSFSTELLSKTKVIFGEFSNRASVSSWRKAGNFQQVEGVGDFYQRWPEVVFSKR